MSRVTGQAGLDADVTDRYGNTVLLVAAALGHLSVVHAAVEARRRPRPRPRERRRRQRRRRASVG